MIAETVAVIVPVPKRLLATGTLTPTGGVVHVEAMARRAKEARK